MWPVRVIVVGYASKREGTKDVSHPAAALNRAGLVPLVVNSLARARETSNSWKGKMARVCIARADTDGLHPCVVAQELRLAAPWWDLVLVVPAGIGDVERIALHRIGVVGFSPPRPDVTAALALALASRHAIVRSPRGGGREDTDGSLDGNTPTPTEEPPHAGD